MEPSSSTKGFFQSPPVIPPQYEEDSSLRRIISLHLPSPIPPSIDEDLSRFSRFVLSKPVLSYVADAERHPPSLQPLTTFGAENKQNPLVTSEGWRALQDIGIKEGIVGLGYEDTKNRWNSRVYQFIKYHLWCGSSALVTCPSAMTDGAASLLGKHLNDENGAIFAEARRRLISRDPDTAWTSGQWMTERKGGSDVRGTETIARKLEGKEKQGNDGVDAVGMELGPWQIDGFKWFSSATDADMTVLLAKTGPDGKISAFYAPLWRHVKGSGSDNEPELNGVRIQRLKNKLGTKALPTAELELKGMRGYLLGKEGEGVKEISTILNITRMHNIISAVGGWGRGLAISRAFARVRVSGGKLLCDIPAHVRGLAQEHVRYRAHMHLAYFVAALLGCSEGHNPSNNPTASSSIIPHDAQQIKALLRVLTPLAKAQTALSSISGLRACMESLGGVGYLENEDPALNVARLFRDANVLSIWEGTTDIMADDLIRVIKGAGGSDVLAALGSWVAKAIAAGRRIGLNDECQTLKTLWDKLSAELAAKDRDELKWKGRDYLQDLDTLVCGCLLVMDAARDGNEIAIEIARRWTLGSNRPGQSWRAEADWDRKIVFGDPAAPAKL
ncbi:acyl-CoA dehydrogenase/oxidase [Thermoascus aurantiacus ATCC 26904]